MRSSETSPFRTALVTGASRGIGAAIVRALRAEGLEVWAVARSAQRLEALAAETGCRALPLDVTDTAALEAAIGPLAIDVAVINAGGVSAVKPLHEMGRHELDSMLDLNVKAAFHTVRVVLPGMVARRFGHLFLVSSIAAHHPYPAMAVYTASKAAVSMLVQNLRLDLVGTGIRVTELAPGRVETDIYLEALGGDRAAVRERLYAGFRSIQPEEVARVLVDALRLPPHVDLSRIDIVPTDQAFGGVALAHLARTEPQERESSQR
jgi:NADP-dependent 3-hydroxy acid dehydrogenase YdfG